MKPVRIGPRFRALPPPLIVAGMHRSGTSLVAGMLIGLGVSLDPAWRPPGEGALLTAPDERMREEGYGEAQAFRLLNECVMARTDAAWDNVDPFLERRDRPAFARASLALLQRATYRSLCTGYLDLLPEAEHGPWGWKDPRNSLLLPYWLRLFPAARILHVRRDPEKVVNSLLRRSEAWDARPAVPPSVGSRLQRAIRHPDAALRAIGRRVGILRTSPSSPPLPERERWLRLCDRYVQECARYHALGGQYLEIRFEEIGADPAGAVARLAEFAGVRPSPLRLEQVAGFVQPPAPRKP